MFNHHIQNDLDRINLEIRSDVVHDSLTHIMAQLYEHHSDLLANIYVSIPEDETICIQYFHNDLNKSITFIWIDDIDVWICKCTIGGSFDVRFSNDEVEENFIKKFQYVIYNANFNNH